MKKSNSFYLFVFGLVLLLSLLIAHFTYSHAENNEVTYIIFNMSLTISEWIYTIYFTIAYFGGGLTVIITLIESKTVKKIFKKIYFILNRALKKRAAPYIFWVGIFMITLYPYMFHVLAEEPGYDNGFTIMDVPTTILNWELYTALEWSIPLTGLVFIFEGLLGFKTIFKKGGKS